MTAALKSRVARLEARHKAATDKPKGAIGGTYGQLVPNPNKPGYLMFSHPPEGFAAFAANQQSDLQALLRELADEPAPKHPAGIVSKTSSLAPIKPGKKRARYIEINGVEIDALALRGNEK